MQTVPIADMQMRQLTIQKCQSLTRRLAQLRALEIAIHALVRASATCGREYATIDKAKSRYFTELTAKSVGEHKRIIGEIQSLESEYISLSRALRAGDPLIKLSDLAAEDAEMRGI